MAKREILAGATDQTIDVFIQDSSSTVGAGLTGLVFNTASLVCYYRKGATGTPTALTLATQTVGGAHSDGGFVAVDGTNCPGQYRLDLSDTIVATAGMTTIYLNGAANMVPCVSEIEVVAVNKFDAVRMGMTALPNAAADAAGGLPISDAGGLDLDAQVGTKINDILTDTGTTLDGRIPAALVAGRIDASVGAMAADVITAAAAAADFTTELQSGLATSSSVATLQTSVDDLPTNAELATSQAAADDATLAAIAALNNLSSAQAQTAAAAALTAYDPPTNAEMEARTIVAATYATVTGVSAVETDTQDIQSRLPTALVGGRIDATVDATGMESGAIDAILDDTIGDGTLTMRQALRVLIAGMAGKLSGAATTTVTIRNTADSANVIVATVDADGNRSAVTVTP